VKLALLIPAALVVAAAVGGTAVASATHAAGGPPCVPKIVKIDGKTAVENCGPATATVSVSGKTYSFKTGLCSVSGKTFLLQLGTAVAGVKGNAGYPDLSLTTNGTNAIATTDYKGKDIIPVTDFLLTVQNAGKNTGTFSSGRSTPKLTGSWNCHGVIYKSPS
jgi:hypothetical protein